MLPLLLTLAVHQLPNMEQLFPPPPVYAAPGADNGPERMKGALLGTLAGGTASVVLAGIAFLIGMADKGMRDQGLVPSLALAAGIGGLGLMVLMPSAASWGHQAYGGKSTWLSGILGFGIGASVSSLMIFPAVALMGKDRNLPTVLIVASIPLPLVGMLFGLEVKHRMELGI